MTVQQIKRSACHCLTIWADGMANQPVGYATFHGLHVAREGVAVGPQRINQQARKAAERQLDDLRGLRLRLLGACVLQSLTWKIASQLG